MVTFYERKTITGSTISGSLSGYGAFPFERFKGVPVIDFTGLSFERYFEGLLLHDQCRPNIGLGDIAKFVKLHKGAGFKVIE